MLGCALVQLAGTPEPLFTWLTDQVERGGDSLDVLLEDPEQARADARLCGPLGTPLCGLMAGCCPPTV